MEDKQKKSDFSIRTTFRKWLEIQGINNGVLLFGNTASGKTTLCHLLKKFIDKVQDPNLKFVQNKKVLQCEYEGQINQKTTKPLTIYPRVFKIQNSDIQIVQIPSRIYQLQPKKRPYLDKIINTVGLIYAVQEASLVFLVQAKNTGSKFQAWKKLFQSFFDSLNVSYLNKQTSKSVGFIVTKGGPQIDNQIYLNRMEALYLLFEQRKKNQYTQLLDTIRQNKHLTAFTKISSQQQAEKQIIQITEFIKSLPKCRFLSENASKEYLFDTQVFELSKEQILCFNDFNQCLRSILRFFATVFNNIFAIQGNAHIPKLLENELKKQIGELSLKAETEDQKCQTPWSNAVLIRYNQLLKVSKAHEHLYESLIGKSNLLFQYKAKIQPKRQSKTYFLKEFLNILAQHGLILQNMPQLRSIYLRLIEYAIFQQRFSSKIKSIDYQQVLAEQKVTYEFRQAHYNTLKQWIKNEEFSVDQTPQKARMIINIWDKFYPDQEIKDSQLQNIKYFVKTSMILQKFNEETPLRWLPQLYELLEQFIDRKKLQDTPEKRAFSKKLALKTAYLLKKINRPELCCKIYLKCGWYHSAKICYQEMLQDQKLKDSPQKIQPILMNCLDLLTLMSLEQTALNCCYLYAEKHNELRPQILQKMKNIKQKKNQKFSPQFQTFFLGNKSQLIQYYVDSQLLMNIKQIADSLKSQADKN